MTRLWGVLSVATLVGLGVLVGPAAPACACSCAGPVGPAEAADRSTAVFSGTVRDVDRPWGLMTSSADPVAVTIEVAEVYKGEVPAEVVVSTAAESPSCGYHFEVGGRYLVFADGALDDLRTGLCSGNRDLASVSNPFGGGGPPATGGVGSGWPAAGTYAGLVAGGALALVLIFWWWPRIRRIQLAGRS